MNIDLTTVIPYIVFALLGAMSTYIVRGLLERVEQLETKMSNTTSEVQVRQYIKDRYDPLAEDIREIKEMQHRLFDMYVQSLKSNKDD